jgi:hypothetical protein
LSITARRSAVCIFDIGVFGLASPALGGEDTAAMDFIEISVQKFEMSFSVFTILVVCSQNHLPYSTNSFFFDELLNKETRFRR